MNIGWWLQFVGGILGVISAILVLFGFILSPKENIFRSINNIFQVHYGSGDNISDDKFVFNQPRELYSSTQSVLWPTPPNNETQNISIDGLLELSVFNGNATSIKFISNVVTQAREKYGEPGKFTVIGSRAIEGTEGSGMYEFDTNRNQKNEFSVSNRKFVVTLTEIKEVKAESILPQEFKTEARFYKYSFIVREIEQ